MNTWFLCTVKYTKQQDNGTFSRVSEKYLLAAMTFSDAEARIYEELGSIIRGEFVVQAIVREELHDIFAYEDADIWYKSKISFEGTDESGGKTKRTSQTFLVSASSVREATERLQESLSTMLVTLEVTGTIKSPIIEVFSFKEELDIEISRKAPLTETVSED